jgi:hypothetical protein
MGIAASTPILKRFSSPVDVTAGPSVVRNGDFSLDADGNARADKWEFSTSAKQAKGRWLEGLYVDKPEEWDDPYRFFRW